MKATPQITIQTGYSSNNSELAKKALLFLKPRIQSTAQLLHGFPGAAFIGITRYFGFTLLGFWA